MQVVHPKMQLLQSKIFQSKSLEQLSLPGVERGTVKESMVTGRFLGFGARGRAATWGSVPVVREERDRPA